MASLKKREVDKQLRGKLDGDCDESDGDHYFYFFAFEGRQVLRTKMSRPRKGDIGDQLIGLMAKQLQLTAADFRDYVNCSKSAADWANHLAEIARTQARLGHS